MENGGGGGGTQKTHIQHQFFFHLKHLAYIIQESVFLIG